MTKRQLINEITDLNPTADPAFLARFEDMELAEYLEHLRWVASPRSRRSAEEATGLLFGSLDLAPARGAAVPA